MAERRLTEKLFSSDEIARPILHPQTLWYKFLRLLRQFLFQFLSQGRVILKLNKDADFDYVKEIRIRN